MAISHSTVMSTTPRLSSVDPSVTGFVLIVDDTPANLEVISETLSDAGFDVAIATSGDRALQQLNHGLPDCLPDLILLDVMMAGMDGFETCRQIKANPHTCHIPIIFMTALAEVEQKVKALDLGAVDYIAKPFHEKEVLARVRIHLQLHALTQNLAEQVAQKTAALQASQLQLIQSEKMSTLGNLVAGVAHEINNPICFLNGSISHAQKYVKDLLGHLALYQQHYPNPVASIQKNAEEIDLDFLRQDFPTLLDSMKGATDRILSISTSLRTFSRADTEFKVIADLHEGIDSTLLILKYRLKANEHRPEIVIIKNYGNLPLIECFPGQLNQVFMNVLANAIDVFDEMAQQSTFEELESKPQVITLQTAQIEQNTIEIRIGDNGKGMTESVQAKVFDHLFTTKGVGKGTGLGLAIARQIVVDKHSGSLEVKSEMGQGSEFCIRLPIHTRS
jgi:signal transduction histidine kinase